MKEELEDTILEWLKTLEFEDKEIADSFIRGRADKPSGNSTIIVDFHRPITQKPREQRIGTVTKKIKGQGTITCIYKAVDPNGNLIKDAEKFNDKVPDLIVDTIFKDPTLESNVPGSVDVTSVETGYLELRQTEDNYPFISVITFEYDGLWVSPIIE